MATNFGQFSLARDEFTSFQYLTPIGLYKGHPPSSVHLASLALFTFLCCKGCSHEISADMTIKPNAAGLEAISYLSTATDHTWPQLEHLLCRSLHVVANDHMELNILYK